MAKFQPGQSGNPAGRPPKSRALSDLLEKALSKTVETPEGKVAGKRLLAQLVSDALTTGRVKFPQDETYSMLGVKDWLEFVKWFYGYMEPPPTKLEHTGEGGGAVKAEVKVIDGSIISKLLPELATSGATKASGETE